MSGLGLLLGRHGSAMRQRFPVQVGEQGREDELERTWNESQEGLT